MASPTIKEAIDHLREHFGLSMGETLALLRTPIHPAGLRDDFAGQALPAAISALNSGGMLTVRGEQLEMIAKYAYDIADAMLAERAK